MGALVLNGFKKPPQCHQKKSKTCRLYINMSCNIACSTVWSNVHSIWSEIKHLGTDFRGRCGGDFSFDGQDKLSDQMYTASYSWPWSIFGHFQTSSGHIWFKTKQTCHLYFWDKTIIIFFLLKKDFRGHTFLTFILMSERLFDKVKGCSLVLQTNKGV